MYKVLIVSDSHGLTNELTEIRARYPEVDMALHCGDSELLQDSPHLDGYTVVRGNCDFRAPFPNEQLIDVGDMKIFLTHGHLFDVKQHLMRIQYAAEEKEADIVCFGHSHIAYAEKVDQQLFINPGSIRLPKKYPTASYMLLSWADKSEITATFYEVDGTEITSFPYQNKFNLK